jgi:predicted HD superfamily hydrolase involved in NAD metabolism
MIDETRLRDTMAHEQRTAQLARELALAHGVDPNRAELVALLHDIADHYSDAELLLRAQQYGLLISAAERQHPRLLHGPVGAALLGREYGIRDAELLDAVRDHVTGGLHMSTLGKIIFIADKLEPLWGHPANDGAVRTLAREQLDCAVLKLQAARIAGLAEDQLPVMASSPP